MKIGEIIYIGTMVLALTCGIFAERYVKKLEKENAALKAHNNEISHQLAELLVSSESKEREALAEKNAKLLAVNAQLQHAFDGMTEYNRRILTVIDGNCKSNLPPLKDLPRPPTAEELLGNGPMTAFLPSAEKN